MPANSLTKKASALFLFISFTFFVCFVTGFSIPGAGQSFNNTSTTSKTQSCLGSLGDPILYETFGRGNGYGPPVTPGYTTLGYQPATCPYDGNYAIVNYTSGCWASDVVWHNTGDHTQDGLGYFMLINASYTPSDFYTRRVDDLCEGTTYQFGAWLLNMCSVKGILPNITFTIETLSGSVLAKKNTGDIPITNPAKWMQDTLNFTTPAGISSVVLRMRNNAPGGMGNDVGLDDITFRPIGPKTTISVEGYTGSIARVCNKTVKLTGIVDACYLTDSYQWQSSQDSISWTNIPGADKLIYNVPANNTDDTVYYRLLVAQQGNIAITTCRVNSNIVTIISGSPVVPALADTSATICNGRSFILPSGKAVEEAGIYKDTLRNNSGCDSLITTLKLSLYIPARKSLSTIICDGDSYILPSGKKEYASGTYTDTLYRVDGCDSIITTLALTVIKATVNNATVNICPGTAYVLPSGKKISTAGVYYDTVQSVAGCDSIISIIKLNFVHPVNKTIDAAICNGQDYLLPSGKTINKEGIYSDTLRSLNLCDSIIFHVSVHVSAADALSKGFLLPGAFTPNNDGLNDCFGIKKWGVINSLYFAVYNRWGQRIFYSSGAIDCWDGKYKDLLQPQGTYVYNITAQTACGRVNRTGVVVLLR